MILAIREQDRGDKMAHTHAHSRGGSGAAQTRKLMHRELRRLGAEDLSVYVDGRRNAVRFAGKDAPQRRRTVPAADALGLLRSLPDGSGPDATLDALTTTHA